MDNNLPQPLDRTFRIGAWIARPDSNELHSLNRDGEVRSLEPRLMQLLCILASAPHRVFTRSELMDHLWPRVIVNDNSLTRAVSELRKMLNDDGKPYIDTIPKSGYRLAATCVVANDVAMAAESVDQTPDWTPQTVPADLPHPAARQHPLTRLLPTGAALSLLLAVFAVVLQMMPQETTRNTQLALADVNLTSQAAVDALMEGKFETVATTGDVEELVDISPNSTPPVVSRDGELFAYIRYDDQGSSLMLGSTHLPDSPVTVFTTPDTLYNLQWSPLDRALLFAQSPKFAPAALLPLDETASLVLFDLETFTTRVLDGPAEEAQDERRRNSGLFKLTSLTRNLDWLS